MELLEKFAAVEIKADDRISAADRQYCETQQAAYQSALAGFRELAFFIADMRMRQEELLGPRKGNARYHNYLASPDGPNMSQGAIDAHIEYLHTDFIRTLIRHFNTTYSVAINGEEICKAILPQEPPYRANVYMAHYHEQMQSLTVHYQSVVEQMILRLDGRSFPEQAFHELYERCHAASWNLLEQTPKFEVVKSTVRFPECFCYYECGICERWKLREGIRDILRGAAHFETGDFRTFPDGVSELLDGRYQTVDFLDWPSCEKIKGLKMFKNTRGDLKFSSEKFAREFVQKYLGMVC